MQSSNDNRAFAGNDTSAARWFAEGENWWTDHFVGAVDQAVEFLAGDGISTVGAQLIDLGCGDGIIALGLCRRAQTSSVLGVDLVEVDIEFLNQTAQKNGADVLSQSEPISFSRSMPDKIPVAGSSVDIVTAWSVFEHVENPLELLKDVHRVLRPGGALFIQIWPMWNSEHGSHLWPWFDQSFHHLIKQESEIAAHLQLTISENELASAMFDLYQSCNRTTVDQLQLAIVDAGLYLAKVELQTNTFHVPPELQRVPISRLGICGVKILAVKQ